eukprot:6177144-Pleurochrysis_carterae.AAC.2
MRSDERTRMRSWKGSAPVDVQSKKRLEAVVKECEREVVRWSKRPVEMRRGRARKRAKRSK